MHSKELPGTAATTQVIQDSGTFTVPTDQNYSFTKTLSTTTWSGGALTTEQETALETALDKLTIGNDGTWNYSASVGGGNCPLDFLKSSETLTLSYSIQVNDSTGNPVGGDNVTVTITGRDDVPNFNTATISGSELWIDFSDAAIANGAEVRQRWYSDILASINLYSDSTRTTLIGNGIESVVDFTNNTLKLGLNNTNITSAGVNTGDTLYSMALSVMRKDRAQAYFLKSAADGSEVVDFTTQLLFQGRCL